MTNPQTGVLEFATSGLIPAPAAGHGQIYELNGAMQASEPFGPGASVVALGPNISGSVNSQNGQYRWIQSVGETTANGQTVVLTIPIGSGHQTQGWLEVSGRVTVAGASAVIGDETLLVAYSFGKNVGGAVSFAQSAVIADNATSGSQSGNTIAVTTGVNTAIVTITQGGAPNVGATIDWMLQYRETLQN